MDRELMVLEKELTQGKELAKQLRNHLNPSSSNQTRDYLIQKILGSYEKALSVLNCGASVVEPKINISMLETPSSFANISPRCEASNLDCEDQCHRDVFKKRKTMPRWTEQVKACAGTGLEGHPDDGYCWRKYGQKDILGANFPRGYYRCTHRHAQGCLATKQVQRSDGDPSIVEVTYRGRHTCNQNSNPATVASPSVSKVEKNHYLRKQEHDQNPKQEEVMFKFGAGCKVKTEGLDNSENIFPSFPFPPTSIEAEYVAENIFQEAMLENNIMGSFSQAFISPTTSESNYFPVSPSHMNNFGLGHGVQTSDSDLTEIISAPTSVTNSPIGEAFDFIKVDFDPNFPFDNLEFFA
uniref:WRKY transcription factor 6-1 n=1 Tax=Dimocarpus longan TaxID=128017 RepID=G3FF79_9ROSI|nr:WRKY transcription factor 6-1 [Dimocarpus longan]